jgi:hypothetical protein
MAPGTTFWRRLLSAPKRIFDAWRSKMYLVITNAGSLNRKKLELIGLSSKRCKKADTETIGHKGSGTKLAAMASVRLELDVAIASTDHIGTYLLSYEVEKEKAGDLDYERLVFHYHPSYAGPEGPVDERVPRDLTVEAFEDWDKPIGDDPFVAFKVLREFVCNARDEQKDFRIGVTDKPGIVPPGTTAVYIKVTPEVARMVRVEANRYFKFLAKDAPLFDLPALGSVYPKSDPVRTRLFLLGVLVDCHGDGKWSSLYDYSLNDKSLISEERILKNFWSYLNDLAKLFGQLTDPALVASIMVAVDEGRASLEDEVLSRVRTYTPASRPVWLAAVHAVYGPKLAVTAWNETMDRDAEQIFGYRVIGRGRTNLQTFFKYLGIPEVKDVVPTAENFKYELVGFDALESDSKAALLDAYRLFVQQYPERAALPIALFHPLNEASRHYAAGLAGLGDEAFKQIWVATRTPTALPDREEIFKTLAHESRHCVSGAGDYDRAFLNMADDEIAVMAFRQGGEKDMAPGKPVPGLADPSAHAPNFVDPKTGKPARAPTDEDETTDPFIDIGKLFDEAFPDMAKKK